MADKKIFFQTIHVGFTHPETGEESTRMFVGRALLTPEEIEKHKDKDIHQVINSLELDLPYNPYEDEANDKAHARAMKTLRAALAEMEATDGSDDKE